MNRKMLVVALSAACASPLALADVTIYGTLNNSLESVKATGAANSANDVKSTLPRQQQHLQDRFQRQ
jgi:predicted porin